MKLYINNKEVLAHRDNLYEFVKAYYVNKTPATYKEEDCNLKSLQCNKDANRSFQDMLWLCQTYFPDTTDKQLAVIWRKLYDNAIIEVFYCADIHKVVSYNDSNPGCWQSDDYHDLGWYYECEYGWSKNSIYDLATK